MELQVLVQDARVPSPVQQQSFAATIRTWQSAPQRLAEISPRVPTLRPLVPVAAALAELAELFTELLEVRAGHLSGNPDHAARLQQLAGPHGELVLAAAIALLPLTKPADG
jgi:hypothetical protein